ncbi:MAG: CoA transferase [Actinomycetota bacterium]|nr:CoA transferase [Actinomycetota bacterium]
MTEPPSGGALSGYRVIDLTTVLMGPLATRALGDHGADVIRVEPVRGDDSRRGEPARHPGMSAMVLTMQRNKRSVALDLKDVAGREVMARLVASADVLVTNVRRAALERLGLDAATTRAANPRLVHCVANGYGPDGPYADRPAYDDAIQAASGLASLVGEVTGEPAFVPTVVVDKVAGLTIVQAVIAALLHRERTGEGQAIEVPMFETMAAFNLVEHLQGHAFEPPVGDIGYRRLLTGARRPYRSADGWVCLLPYNDNHWRAFLAAIGRPELVDDPRFATHNARITHVEETYGLLAEVAPSRTTAAWLELCDRIAVPAAEVRSLAELVEDPHLRAVGLVGEVEHPTEGTYRVVADPVHYERSPTALRRHAPRLGEHTAEVLTDLGYTPEQVRGLIERGTAAG